MIKKILTKKISKGREGRYLQPRSRGPQTSSVEYILNLMNLQIAMISS